MRFSPVLAAFGLTSAVTALTSSLEPVSGFNAGPTAAAMFVYVPANKPSPAPIVVALHYCGGSATALYNSTQYAQYADTYGFIVIYPNSPAIPSDGCWDVASAASLTHNGGGDSQTIVNMVSYAVKNYGGDATRVYAVGSSSGAMMTNVLAGAYPDVFQACSTYSGVPDGCFYIAAATAGMAIPRWNAQCADGNSIQSPQAWGDLARSYYPGYSGARPRMMLWHATATGVVPAYANLNEGLKQWSNVLNVPFSHNTTNSPTTNYTKMIYGDGMQLVGYSAIDVGFNVPFHELIDLAWFCISAPCAPGVATHGAVPPVGSVPSSSAGPSVPTNVPQSIPQTVHQSLPPAIVVPSPLEGTATEWQQCGGIGWTGAKGCVSGLTCMSSDPYFSQCV